MSTSTQIEYGTNPLGPDNNSFAINSKIMIVAVVVLFGVVMFILGLHIYAKWFWSNSSGQRGSLNGGSWRRRRRLEFAADWPGQQRTTQVGLEKSVLDKLPTFVFSEEKAAAKEGLECAVCLEEFADGEEARLLPKCNHTFHIECIDMWFHSHSSCPLCRCSVAPDSSVPSSELALASAPREDLSHAGDVAVDISEGVPSAPSIDSLDARQVAPAGMEHRAQLFEAEVVLPSPRPSPSVPESPSGRRPSVSLSPKSSGVVQYPANVLFWGNQTEMNVYATSGRGLQREGNATRRPAVNSPNCLVIEIPRGPSAEGAVGASLYATAEEPHRSSDAQGPKSPIGRLVTSSFRRLLSIRRGATSPGPESTLTCNVDCEQGAAVSSATGTAQRQG